MESEFNLIVAGYGGQGVLTIAKIISKAALKEGYDVKQAELHGLAQRGGSLQCYVRFGKKIDSPLIRRGGADLIIALDLLEAKRVIHFANKNTKVLINSKIFRFKRDKEKVLVDIKKHTNKLHVVKADEVVKKLTGNIMDVNVYVLGYALRKKLLPLKKESVWDAIKEKIGPKFLEGNKKVFEEDS